MQRIFSLACLVIIQSLLLSSTHTCILTQALYINTKDFSCKVYLSYLHTHALFEVILRRALADYISPFHAVVPEDVDVIWRHSSAVCLQRFNSFCHPETLSTRRPVLEIQPVTCRTWWSANIGQCFLSQPQRKATLICIQERDLLFRRIPSCCSATLFRVDFPI